MESVEHPDADVETAEPSVLSDAAQRPVADLDVIERDLADVEIALARLDAGTYWTCEETGAPLPDELLESTPTARRLPAT